jgi:hypothetical protein
MLACYEEILEKKSFFFCHTSVLHFFKSSSETLAPPPVLLNICAGDTDGLHSIK